MISKLGQYKINKTYRVKSAHLQNSNSTTKKGTLCETFTKLKIRIGPIRTKGTKLFLI